MDRIHILFPVLNEERRLEKGVHSTVSFMDKHFSGRYAITLMDNGSTDKTEELSRLLTERYDNVHYIKLPERGVGLALRAGVAANNFEIVGYMDIDLSTKLEHLLEVDHLFTDENVQIVNGSRLSKGSKMINRSFQRKCTSQGLRFLLKILLGMKIDDAICGFKFFRKQTIEYLMAETAEANGWFYCVELLIRAEKSHIRIVEIPVVWEDDPNTTVRVPSLILNYMINIFRLRRIFYKNLLWF